MRWRLLCWKVLEGDARSVDVTPVGINADGVIVGMI